MGVEMVTEHLICVKSLVRNAFLGVAHDQESTGARI